MANAWWEEQLLGFDLRVDHTQPDPLWDAARRRCYLLRQDVPRPLAADNVVWPSVFDTGEGIGMPAAERERFSFTGIPLPAWIGPSGQLWTERGAMWQTASGSAGGVRRMPATWTELAVTWLSDNHFAPGDVGPWIEPVDPPTLNADWRLLGYDVGDGSFLSGLTNCGCLATDGDAEAGAIAQRWRPSLNAFHLFVRPEDAFAFRELSDQRIPEHAPFFVSGLYVAATLPSP
jgi:hypothetical protein